MRQYLLCGHALLQASCEPAVLNGAANRAAGISTRSAAFMAAAVRVQPTGATNVSSFQNWLGENAVQVFTRSVHALQQLKTDEVIVFPIVLFAAHVVTQVATEFTALADFGEYSTHNACLAVK
jgi:hypothetical protein